MILAWPICILAGGILNRFRGGMWPTGHTQLTRALYSLGLALLVLLETGDPVCAAVTVPLWFVGALAPHGAWMNARDWGDVLSGSSCGVLTVMPAAVALWWFGHPGWHFLPALGLTQGPLYWLGWRLPTVAHDLETGTGWGEALFGLAMGAGIAAAGVT